MHFTTRFSVLSLMLVGLLALAGCTDGEGGSADGGPGPGPGPVALTITTGSLPGVAINTPYNANVTASGGSGSGFLWAVTAGALPGGIALADGTPAATLSGTPTATGTFNFTLQVTDDGLNTAAQALSVVVTAAPGVLTINTVALSGGSQGVSYAAGLSAGGGSGAGYNWAVIAGALPGGLTLTSGTPTASLDGTPTTAGTFNFTVEVTDSASNTAQRAFQLVIITTPLSIVTATLPAAITGQAYSQTVSAAGGTPPYTWTLVSSTPASTFTLASGTPNATLQGTHLTAWFLQLRIRVQDSASAQAEVTLSLQVADPIAIYYQAPAGAALNQPFSVGVTTSGGTGAGYQWSVAAGTLPPGLALSGGTPAASISGTPTTAGAYNFTLQVQDGASSDTQAYTINVGAAVSISTLILPNADNGTAYSQAVTATGGDGSFAWVLLGTLPAGLSFTTGSPSATISGTAGASGVYSFWARVTDGNAISASRLFTLTVNPAGGAFAITTTSLPDASVGTYYSFSLGATSVATWALAAGVLPIGFGLSAAGVLFGDPVVSGDFTFTVRADAGGGVIDQRVLSLHIDAAAAALTITTAALPAGVTGAAYSVTLTAAGGTGTGLGWSITSGTPQAGLALVGAMLSGVPTVAGAVSLTFLVQDSGAGTDSITLNLTIAAANAALEITTANLPGGTQGGAYAESIRATGGSAPYSWTVTAGNFPAGLILTDGTPAAALSGAPAAGSFGFTVQVTDAASVTASRVFNVVIAAGSPSLAIDTQLLAPPVLGTAYSQPVGASGGTGSYAWSLQGGILPYGLALGSGTPFGSLTGTPTVSGAYRFALQVRDSNGATAIKTYTLVVSFRTAVQVEFTEFSPPAIAGSLWSASLRATGGTGYAWSLIYGLPAGWTMTPNGDTAIVSGTVPVAGTTITVLLRAQDTGSVAEAVGGWALYSRAAGDTPKLDAGATTSKLPGGTLDKAYRIEMGGDYGTGVGQAWSVVSGQLPPGLVLNRFGTAAMIEGVPLVLGAFGFDLMLEDSGTSSDVKHFEITVSAGANLYGLNIGAATVLVLDASASMSGNRYRTMRREVENAILAMEDSDQFDMVPFESAVHVCWGVLRPATPANRAEALAFIHGGGIAPVGATATYPALQYSLSNYASFDTLVLVTDGSPNVGGTATGILQDFPTWWLPFSGADFIGVGIGLSYGGSTQLFLTALTGLAGGAYVDR